MAQNYKYYNLIGDNGYGLFSSWDDLQEAALKLKGSLFFRGYLTAREAYNGILRNVMFRWKIRQVGVIDLAALMKKQLVLLDNTEEVDEDQDAPATVGSIYRKKAKTGGRVCMKKCDSLDEILDEEDIVQEPVEQTSTDKQEKEMYQLFKSWYKNRKKETGEKSEVI